MVWLDRLGVWFRALFKRQQLAKEFDSEMKYHLDELMREKLAEGMSLEAARHAAQRSFGNLTAVREEAREIRGGLWLAQFSEDLRRHLTGLPVVARKDTFSYRAEKFVRRHKAGVAALALLSVLTVTLAVLFTATLPLALPPSSVTGSVAEIKNEPASTFVNCAVPLVCVEVFSVPPNCVSLVRVSCAFGIRFPLASFTVTFTVPKPVRRTFNVRFWPLLES